MGYKSPKYTISTLEACNQAVEILKSAGFVFVNYAMNSESTYYKLPGRVGLIRVSTHVSKHVTPGLITEPIIAKITISPDIKCKIPDTLEVTEHSIFGMVANCIGRYMIKSKKEIENAS